MDVLNDFSQRVEPLIPARQRVPGEAYLRQPGAARPPKPARLVFEAILYGVSVEGLTCRAFWQRQC